MSSNEVIFYVIFNLFVISYHGASSKAAYYLLSACYLKPF